MNYFLQGQAQTAHELTESVQAKLSLLIRRVLHKYTYPPDKQGAAVEQVLEQAEALADAWS